MRQLTFDPDVVRLVANGLRYGVLDECEVLAGIMRLNRNPFVDDPEWPSERLLVVRLKEACSVRGDCFSKMRAYQAWCHANIQRWREVATSAGNNKSRSSSNRRSSIISDKEVRSTSGGGSFPTNVPINESDLLAEQLWCDSHFLSLQALLEIQETASQVRETLVELGLAEPLPKVFVDGIAERARVRRKLLTSPYWAKRVRRAWSGIQQKSDPKWILSGDLPSVRSILSAVADPVRSMQEVLASMDRERSNVLARVEAGGGPLRNLDDRAKILAWTVAASYPQNLLSVDIGHTEQPSISFISRKHIAGRRKKKSRNAAFDLHSKQQMEWFLHDYLQFRSVRGVHTSDNRREPGTNVHRVTFSDRAELRRALQLRATNPHYPYTKMDFNDCTIATRRRCWGQERGAMILSTDSACAFVDQGGRAGLVALGVLSSVNARNNNSFLCLEFCRVPAALAASGILDLAVDPLFPNLRFRGTAETTSQSEVLQKLQLAQGAGLDDFRAAQVISLAESICVDFDREWKCNCRGERMKIVRARADAVVQIMDILEVAERQTREVGAKAAEQNRVSEVEMEVPSGKMGKVIGKRGATIKQLEQETGARLSTVQGTNTLKIKGTREQIKAARQRVHGICGVLDPLRDLDLDSLLGALGGMNLDNIF